ncbi:MAG: hypothetical protein CFE37_13495 [Alphaproteobacteria bacterium PA4]|nr:MAG: hypothetical protein CFE37_13495 [Alphaproteobacteria bacterium PA4]
MGVSEARGVKPQVFDDPAIDALVKMLLELASETWVTRARLAALEAKVGSVEDLVLPAEVEAALAAERDAFVKKIFGVLER